MAFNNIIDRSGAVALMPEEVSYKLIKELKDSSLALESFEQIPVSRGQERMPVISALPIAYFVGADTGIKQTTQQDWKNKYMNIEEIACIVPIPEAVLEDVEVDLWAQVEPKLKKAIARTMDAAVMFEEGAPSVWPEGIIKAAKKAGNYKKGWETEPKTEEGSLANTISQMMGQLEDEGFDPNFAAAKINMKNKFRNTRNTLGEHLPELNAESVYGIPVQYPARGLWPAEESEKAQMFMGEREQFVVGIRTDIDMKLLDQAVIEDNEGNTIFNTAQEDLVAIRARFRCGWQVSNQVTYDEPEEANRYPASVLYYK